MRKGEKRRKRNVPVHKRFFIFYFTNYRLRNSRISGEISIRCVPIRKSMKNNYTGKRNISLEVIAILAPTLADPVGFT